MSGKTGQTSASQLRRYLENQIASGELPSGAMLPSERTLATAFTVSRPLVREVLAGLAQQGLVDIVPAKGTFVRGPNQKAAADSLHAFIRRRGVTVRELVAARIMLECQAASLAAETGDAETIKTLYSALDRYDMAGGMIDLSIADVAFHRTIAIASGNAVISIMYDAITLPTFEMMIRSHSDDRISKAGSSAHRNIVDAIAAHDPNAARDAVQAHLVRGEKYIGEDYERDVHTLATRLLSNVLGPNTRIEDWLPTVVDVAPNGDLP